MKIVVFAEDKNFLIHFFREIAEDEISKKISDIEILSTFELENKNISYGDDTLKISNINSYKDFKNTDFAIFCVRRELTEKYVYDFIENGCIVLDGSDYFMNDSNIPIIDYNVNKKNIKNVENKNIMKLPSKNTLQLTEVIGILNKISSINRVVVNTYQSTSTVGKNAMDELFLHTKKIYENSFLTPVNFKKQIPFNILPQVGDASLNNYYEDEVRLIKETKQIINKKINVTATCVLVPVFSGDCQSLSVEFSDNFNLDDIYDIFEKNEDIITVRDRFEDFNYATPKEIAMENTIFISRIRRDFDLKNVLNLWTVADNSVVYSKNIINIIRFLLEK
ncbi:MAG: hypothetical protein IJ853_00725 [Rickettsiales bacterium]|nr:hypothetical protein [Rickettsiales bacterium]